MTERLSRDQQANNNANQAVENGAWDKWTQHSDHDHLRDAIPEPLAPYQQELSEPSAERVTTHSELEELAGHLALEDMLNDQTELAMAGPPER